ncbi:hypothetical protein ACFQZ4_34725 [Catellatospora coxensis]|uniref:Uncharacterized protein n=1 Tax=Catellatospora coxensis TaxID=310354 RepID=A0A8J3L2Q9_9ACTN|nr:hypothetical protein Cco03nite_33100 [Catellatospora coxensis]
MAERPVARDDAAVEPPPPSELPREPRVSDPCARDADGSGDHRNHDPYQPL